MRNKKSTLDKIKKDLSTHDQRKIVHNVIDNLRGIEKVGQEVIYRGTENKCIILKIV